MLLTLTDHLTCPGCGPTAGLILLMDRAEERRVVEGALGCPVCRTRYRVSGRVADLRDGEPASEAPARDGPGRGRDWRGLGERVGGMMGLGQGGGFALVEGPGALATAAGLVELGTDYEIVVAIDEGEAEQAGGLAASALLHSGRLPLGDGTMRAVAAVGTAPAGQRLGELLRVCRPTGRFAVELAEEDAAALDELADRLASAGATVRARDASGLVAVAG